MTTEEGGTDGAGPTGPARIRGHGDDPSSVRVEVVEHDGGVTLCALYPEGDDECAPGERGSLSIELRRRG